MKNTQVFIATCPLYCEDLLQAELTRFGAKDITTRHGAVHFTGPLMVAYCVCLWSRIANAVLYPLATISVATKEELFEALVKIPFAEHFGVDKTFAVRSHLSETFLDNTNYATLFVKDAIADSFRTAMNKRPNVDAERPDIRFSFFLHKNEATLSIELSSESLHKRSYRRAGVSAPLKENVASAVLLRSEWERFARLGAPLVDLMCGSGTFMIEALYIAADIAPGLLRKNSRLANWNGHDAGLWEGLVKEAEDRKKEGLSRELPRVYGFDNDPEAVSATLENARHAGIDQFMRVSQKNFQETRAPKSDTKPAGLVVVNPPYGERLGEKTELAGLYQDLGKTLCEHYQGYNAAILTGEKELSKAVGLRANRLNTMYNGKIRCTLSHFNIREDNQFRPYTPRFTQE